MKTFLSYTLNKTIDGQTLLKDIQGLLNNLDLSNKILVIKLVDIIKDDVELIPKLTYETGDN